MIFEGLIYFLDYTSIVQVNIDLKELPIEVNYSVNMLFYFLDNDLNLNTCKLWVNYLDDKSLLTPYLVKYSRDSEWVNLLLTFYPEVDYKYRIHELLVSCCKHGHLELVKWLVSNGEDIRPTNYEAFQLACKCGHLEIAKYLFDSIDNTETKKQYIHTENNYVLRSSAKRGHLEVVKWLVKNGANIRVKNYKAFRCACEGGHLEIAKYLLDSIDNAERKKQCIHTEKHRALRWSAKSGHLEVVKWLVNNGANVRVKNYEPFRCACNYGHMETAEYLLSLMDTDEEKELCVRSNDNYALKWSSTDGYLKVVKLLIDNGANVRKKNYEAFRCACEHGHLEIAQYLLSLIDSNEEKKLCVQSENNCALISSVNRGRLEMVMCLVNNGANFRARNYQPFRHACENGYLEIAKYLLSLIDCEEKKLCVQSVDNYALRWSSFKGHLEVVKWLVSNGANIRVDNYQPFRYACEGGRLKIAKYLLSLIDCEEKKLCVQSGDNYALRWSTYGGHLEIVKWLVSNGASITVDNCETFRYACNYGHPETADYLLSLIDDPERN